MNRTAAFGGALLAIACGGLALRLPQLGARPVHGDEAVHAVKFNELWQTGRYVYDPYEFHGPTLYYFTFPVVWLSGIHDFGQTTESTFRIVPVVFGLGLILLLLLVADGLGRTATACAAVLTALSPTMVYYSRYYIQETLLVAFTFLALAATWRFQQTRRPSWVLLAGGAVGLMHATKETCVIAFGALAAAGVVVCVWKRRAPAAIEKPQARRRSWPVPAGTLAAVLVSALLFSGFLSNWGGPVDSLRALATYFNRATAGTHIHPWYYYLHLLAFTHYAPAPVWSELLILILAAIGAATAYTGRDLSAAQRSFARFILVYTALLTLSYSAMPYKTPWSMLGFLHGLILLAGLGAATVLRRAPRGAGRGLVAVALAIGAAHLGVEAWRAAVPYASDQRNPYVYAHPVADVVSLGAWAERLAGVDPAGANMLVQVIAPNPWPLPWYLRRLPHVGYWETPPSDLDAPLIITTPEWLAELEPRFTSPRIVSYYGLRPNELLAACVSADLYQAFVASRTGAAASQASRP